MLILRYLDDGTLNHDTANVLDDVIFLSKQIPLQPRAQFIKMRALH